MNAEDPDNLVDMLPQPYRMIDKVVAQVVEGAIEECLEREKADKVHGLARPEPTKTLDFGQDCTCFATTSDSKQVAAGYRNGKLSLFGEDGAEILSQGLDQGEVQAVVCYKASNGEELYCVYSYGNLALYRVKMVDKEVEVERTETEGGDNDENKENGSPDEPEEPKTVTRAFPEFERVSQAHVREPKSEESKFELKTSLNRRYIGLFTLQEDAEVTFYEVHTSVKAEEPEEEEGGAEGAKDKEAASEGEGGASEAEAEDRPPSYAHDLVEVGKFDKTCAESFFTEALSSLCYIWVEDSSNRDVGIFIWDREGSILVFKQLCPEYVGSISTVSGKNTTWRLPFPISCVAFDAESDLLLIASTKGFISLWNMFYKDHHSFLSEGCHATAMRVVRPADGVGPMIACAASDGSMCLYDMESMRVRKRVILSFIASNVHVHTASKRHWLMHGVTESGEQLLSLIDAEECEPAGSDIVMGPSGGEGLKVDFAVDRAGCSVLTTTSPAAAEADKERDEAAEGEQEKESRRATSSSLAFYRLDFGAQGELAEIKRPQGKASMLEKSVVFQCLTRDTKRGGFEQIDEEQERKALADIRRHLVNLEIQASTTALRL